MTKALLNDMFTKYGTLKDKINKDHDQLALILNEDQIKEIKDSLRKRDVGMAPVLEHRTKCHMDFQNHPTQGTGSSLHPSTGNKGSKDQESKPMSKNSKVLLNT